MQVCPRIKYEKYCSLKLDSYLDSEHLSRPRAVWILWLESSSTDRVSVEVYKTQIFEYGFHPIRDHMFSLSFLTTLDIYKDYFKDRRMWHKLHKCWAKFCSSKLWSETEFVLIHLSCEETAVFVHCKVLWPRSFLIFIVWWTEKLCSQQPSQVGDQVTYWDPCNWLVM